MASILGIDFGTSTTCVSVCRDGQPIVIPVPGSGPVVPSYVHLRDDGKVLIGDGAKAEVIADPYSTIWAAKRLIGRNFSDEGVQNCVDNLPYLIQAGPRGEVNICARDKKFPPDWIASVILRFVANNASRHLGETSNQAVITVPGSFGPEQRDALKKAAEKVGITVVRLLNEPTSAALAWGYHKNADQTIAVFDLGGGTMDVSVLDVRGGKYTLLGQAGDSWLGGEDFDNAIVDRVADNFKSKHKFNIYSDKIAHQRLKIAAENAKIELSFADTARIFLPTILPDLSRVADVDYTMTRGQFEKLVEPLIVRTLDLFRAAVEAAGLKPEQLDNVIMVGGMTRMPLVRARLAELIRREPDTSVNPDQAVAIGAGILAAGLSGQKIQLQPPASTRAEEEYLSGNVDLNAMYDEVLRNQGGEEQPVAAPVAQGWTPGAAAGLPGGPAGVSVSPAGPGGLPQLMLDVHSLAITQDDLNRMLAAAGENGAAKSPWVSGAFALSPDRGEGMKLQVFSPGPNGPTLAGEFVIQSVRPGPGASPHLVISFNVNKGAPLVLKKA